MAIDGEIEQIQDDTYSCLRIQNADFQLMCFFQSSDSVEIIPGLALRDFLLLFSFGHSCTSW